MTKTFLLSAAITILFPAFVCAVAGTPQEQILNNYATEAKLVNPDFLEFSIDRGRAFFLAKAAGGSPETPSCSTCHTTNPKLPGQTRAGKDISPMAISITPDRFTDPEKVEKWFQRNCMSVLGRSCTTQEKGDFIFFLVNQ